jgi:glutathione peroxidase
MNAPLYQLEYTAIDGQPVGLSAYAGKVILIVNVASECGFTPQYAGLEKLWQDYRDRGLVVIGFPCNQFGGQEPGDEVQIGSFCQRNFGVSFPLSKKVEVNGEGAHPLFKYLTEKAPGLMGTRAVKWNFTKFLVSRDGENIERFAPTTTPDDLRKQIEVLLG